VARLMSRGVSSRRNYDYFCVERFRGRDIISENACGLIEGAQWVSILDDKANWRR